MTKQIINTTGLNIIETIQKRPGLYRSIGKCRAGFLVISEFDPGTEPHDILTRFQKGALLTIEFKPEGSNLWRHVFALKGKKVIMIDQDFLEKLTVGDINQNFINTQLYSQHQYQAVGAETWADLAYIKN